MRNSIYFVLLGWTMLAITSRVIEVDSITIYMCLLAASCHVVFITIKRVENVVAAKHFFSLYWILSVFVLLVFRGTESWIYGLPKYGLAALVFEIVIYVFLMFLGWLIIGWGVRMKRGARE